MKKTILFLMFAIAICHVDMLAQQKEIPADRKSKAELKESQEKGPSNPLEAQVSATSDGVPRILIGANNFNQKESGRLSFDEDADGTAGICGFEFDHNGAEDKLSLISGCYIPSGGDTLFVASRIGNMNFPNRVGIGSMDNPVAPWTLSVEGDQLIQNGNLRIVHATDDDQTRIVGASDSKIQIQKTSGSDWVLGGNSIGDFVLMKNVSADDFSDVKNEYEFWTTYFRPADDVEVSLGGINNRWTTVYASNGTVNTSDRREKKNIAPIAYGLDEIMALQPVSYDWVNDSNEKKKLGLIAQDLKEVIDEVVVDGQEGHVREDGSVDAASDRLGVYYSDLIPVLIKGMQEQQAQIEDLKSEIITLKAQIEE